MTPATGAVIDSQRGHVKSFRVSGRCRVTTAKITVISASDVRQYGHAASREVRDMVVRYALYITPKSATHHAITQCLSIRRTKAVTARVKYAIRPQNAVGNPNSCAQRLVSTTSHALPTPQPRTEEPEKEVQDRYAVKRIPMQLSPRSVQFGDVRRGAEGFGRTVTRLLESLFALAFFPIVSADILTGL